MYWSFWVEDCFREKQSECMLLTDDILLVPVLTMKLSAQYFCTIRAYNKHLSTTRMD